MISRSVLLNLVRDVRFWIFLFFAVHLTTITLPPLEPGSAWRQTDGLMIARNFYETDSNILYPRVDVAGDKTGIVGCEFPFLNYLIYLISLVFGYESWYGRLINQVVSSVGVYFFYRLVRHYFDEQTAFNTSILVLVSTWFVYSRTNIPDTFGASLCIISAYYGIKYLEQGGITRLILFLILGALGCLNKISAGCFLALIAIPFFKDAEFTTRKIAVTGCSLLIIGSVLLWYFHWVPYLNETYGFGSHFFMGMSFTDGINDFARLWKESLKRFCVTPFKYSGFALFLFGLFMTFRRKLWLHLIFFILPFLAFTLVVVKSGYGFQLNPYYVIMYIPPMAFVAATGLSQISNRVLMLVLLLTVVGECIGNQIHIFRIREPNRSMTQIEAIMDRFTQQTDRIAINGSIGGDPTPMYFAHRKGLTLSNAEFQTPDFESMCKAMTIRYAVILPKMYGKVDLSYARLYEDEFIVVYKLPD